MSPKIKVVKKADAAAFKRSKSPKKKAPQTPSRSVIANVTDCVSDVRDRKVPDARSAFGDLFGGTPTPTET